jgi:single-strand selective monofunctional uracil DNA glycosylase
MKKMDLTETVSSVSEQLGAASRELSERVGRLEFRGTITHVYNPLEYAWGAHELYLRKYGGGKKRVVFLGMNPGPFGMAQTGVPFGEIAAVRDWLKISAEVGKPPKENPKRLITGFGCERSEVSGRRLWGLFAQRFGTPEKFFTGHFVANYCPLVFCEESGRNFTPDKLPAATQADLFAACDAHLLRVVEILEPEWLIGVGGFAQKRAEAVAALVNTGPDLKMRHQKSQFKVRPHPSPLPQGEGEKSSAVDQIEALSNATPYKVKVGTILHPSPASPAANRGDWGKTATRQLIELGVWSEGGG